MQICSKRTVRQMEEFAIFVNFEFHNNYFRPGPRLLYAKCSFNEDLLQKQDSIVLSLMSTNGYEQLVQSPTTDRGTMNRPCLLQ